MQTELETTKQEVVAATHAQKSSSGATKELAQLKGNMQKLHEALVAAKQEVANKSSALQKMQAEKEAFLQSHHKEKLINASSAPLNLNTTGSGT